MVGDFLRLIGNHDNTNESRVLILTSLKIMRNLKKMEGELIVKKFSKLSIEQIMNIFAKMYV